MALTFLFRQSGSSDHGKGGGAEEVILAGRLGQGIMVIREFILESSLSSLPQLPSACTQSQLNWETTFLPSMLVSDHPIKSRVLLACLTFRNCHRYGLQRPLGRLGQMQEKRLPELDGPSLSEIFFQFYWHRRQTDIWRFKDRHVCSGRDWL